MGTRLYRLLVSTAFMTGAMLTAGCAGETEEMRDSGPRPGSAADLSKQTDDKFWELVQDERLNKYGNREDMLELADIVCDSLEDGVGIMELADMMVRQTPLTLNDSGSFIGLAAGTYCGDAAMDAFPTN